MLDAKTNIIQILKEERHLLKDKLQYVEGLLGFYERKQEYEDLTIADIKYAVEHPSTFSDYKLQSFPIKGSIDEQIKYIIRISSRFLKRTEIEKELEILTGKEVTIREQLRRMVRAGDLAQIVYNSSNKFNFFGLIAWLDDNGDQGLSIDSYYSPQETQLPKIIRATDIYLYRKK